jgi:hypothetical protein
MIYLVGWATLYSVVAIQAATRYRGLVLIFCLVLPYFAAVAFFRGDVGTDTQNYQFMFANFADDFKWEGEEPGFVLLALALIALFSDGDLAVRACALVFFFLVGVFLFRGDKNERFFCLVYFLPATAYLYSMNVLRLGLASVILLLATQAIREGSVKRVFFAGIPAIFFHYSALFSVSYLMASQRPWLNFYSIMSIFALLLLSLGLYLSAEVYLLDKAIMYAPGVSDKGIGPTSGVLIILRLTLILSVLAFGKLSAADKIRLIVLGVGFLLISWIIAQYSYAGVRLFSLVEIVCPLSILASYSRRGLDFERNLKSVFVLAGLMAAANTYLGFLNTSDMQAMPFLPYETW